MAALQDILRSIHDLSHTEKLTLRTMLDEELKTGTPDSNPSRTSGNIIGLFVDEPKVLDGVLAAVSEDRTRPLRIE